MNIDKLLTVAGLAGAEKQRAIDCLLEAHKRADGLLLHKLKARWLMAGKIANVLTWHDERLLSVKPEWAEFDIEPMLNITAQGDNAPWVETIQGGRPIEGHWLRLDPRSADYKKAVDSCYWSKGNHPRSYEARKAWYRRNGGAYRAYEIGQKVDIKGDGVKKWKGSDGNLTVNVYQSGSAWQVNATRKVVGRLSVKTRIGYEITNLWIESTGEQAWYPIPGYDLKAPVTWSVLPTFK
jgi:hypothetical protein